ncbi:MAG: DNA alkylation repair protein [Roseburia sp.]|nr:DNA alkylation repair protein [Roseburia sp.]
MLTDFVREQLFLARDEAYQRFQSRLIPNIPAQTIIGVRTPELRRMAKELAGREDVEEFLKDLPHAYFEENQLHGFIISGMKDWEDCMERLERFLPYIDNWATCDQTSVKVMKKNLPKALERIKPWLQSEHVYTVRFGIGCLMEFYLEDAFQSIYLDWVMAVQNQDYYVKMMVAWYFATALAKQYEAAIPYIEQRRLEEWTHKKTIQKALESYRITREQKEYLRTLR